MNGTIGAFELNGGTVNADSIDFGNNSLTGFGTLNGLVTIGGDVTATGDLTLGDATSFDGAIVGGNLYVGTQSVTINKKGFFNVGTSTVITGGTLTVSDGVSLPIGAGLLARGTINGRIVQQAGSIIEATGDLTLGDSTSPAGFFSDGEMTVDNKRRITLLDANEAVLGSLTTLGGDGQAGAVEAANGAVLEFGKNIFGFGSVETPDNAATPLINNGNITGNDSIEQITLTGYVKGVGTCDNCNITGTDAPGFSTAAVNRGSVSYNGMLEIEIGGTSPGSGFDQLNHILGAGIADLGSTLDVSLIDGFAPTAGDKFEFITAASVLGEFDTVFAPVLPGNLQWFVIYDATSVVLASTYAGDFDFDGDVDGFDFLEWQRGFGDIYDSGDLEDWEANYGMVASLVAASASVPEPTSLVLLGLGGLLALRSNHEGNRLFLSSMTDSYRNGFT